MVKYREYSQLFLFFLQRNKPKFYTKHKNMAVPCLLYNIKNIFGSFARGECVWGGGGGLPMIRTNFQGPKDI